jgi:hypothetical protein
VRILCIKHGVVDCPETAHRLEKVSKTVTGLVVDGKAKIYKNVRQDTTSYAVVADRAEEDGIVDGLVDVVRAQDPYWTVTVDDGQGRPMH